MLQLNAKVQLNVLKFSEILNMEENVKKCGTIFENVKFAAKFHKMFHNAVVDITNALKCQKTI